MSSIENSIIEISRCFRNLADALDKLVKTVIKPAVSKTSAKSATTKTKKRKRKSKAPAKVKTAKTITKKTKAVDRVYGFIKRSDNGITTAVLVEKTGFDSRKIQNAVYKLKKDGKIKTEKRGVFSATRIHLNLYLGLISKEIIRKALSILL